MRNFQWLPTAFIVVGAFFLAGEVEIHEVSRHKADIPLPSIDVRFRRQIGKHLLVLRLPLLNPQPTTEVEATSILPSLNRKTARSVACYRSLHAPRTGGAYDSHHRTAGAAGRNRRRCRCLAA